MGPRRASRWTGRTSPASDAWHPTPGETTDEEKAECERLHVRHDGLVNMDEDEWTAELAAEGEAIETRLAEIEAAVEGRAVFRPEDIAIYWIPVYETLERAGFEVMLVPPRMTKQIGGRKSDVLDCQWIWQLMSYGLLRGAFRPGDEVCPLRSYARQMRRLTGDRSRCVLHMQKALTEMNVKLDSGDRQHRGTDRPAHPARDHRRRA